MKQRKLFAGLISIMLIVSDILPVGFNVSASELEQQSELATETETEPESEQVSNNETESESDTGIVNSTEETATIEIQPIEMESENKTELETEKNTLEETKTQETEKAETETQEKISETKESETDIIEIETQDETFDSETGTTESETQDDTLDSEINLTESEAQDEILETIESETNTSETEEIETEQNIQLESSGSDIASGKYKNVTWNINADGKLTVTGTGDFIEYKTDECPWEDYIDSVISAEINVTGTVNADGILSGHYNMINVDLSNFDTSNITNMSNMFFGCSSLTTLNLNNFDTSKVLYMEDMFGYCTSLTNLNLNSFDTSNVISMLGMFKGCNNLISVDLSSFNTQNVKSMFDMFKGCNKLKSLNLNNFKTDNVDNMNDMFSDCRSLTSLEIKNFNTKNVTDMSSMFSGCSKLSNLDLSSFNTINTTNMREMFRDCSNLASVNLGSFQTKNVTDMYYMFSGCSRLSTLDLSTFDTKNVTDMAYMFSNCTGLINIDVSNFNTANVTKLRGMFSGCSNLNFLDITSFETRNITDMYGMFSSCKSLASLDLSNFDIGNVTNAESMISSCTNLTTIYTPRNLKKSVSLPKKEQTDIWYLPDTTQIAEMPQNLNDSVIIMKNSIPKISEPCIMAEKIQTVYECGEVLTINDLTVRFFSNTGSVTKVTDYTTNKETINMMTAGTKTLEITYNGLKTSIELTVVVKGGNVANGRYENILWTIDTNGKLTVTGTGNFAAPDMNVNKRDIYRAPWYKYRTSIISAEIKAADITDASYMFYNCVNLVNVNLSEFDTQNTIYTQGMFHGCTNLTSIDLSKFKTPNIASMSYMFADCTSLQSLDLSSLHTENVTSMRSMFAGCRNLQTLNISGFDTQKVQDMGQMFADCMSLKTLNVSNFDTKNVTNMGQMFSNCQSLENINLNNFNTLKVTDMQYMFSNCVSLKSLDLVHFNTTLVTNMGGMFSNCNNLLSLDLSSFRTDRTTSMWRMFGDCYSLTNLDLSNFDTRNVTSMASMFFDCGKLQTLNLSSFDARNLKETNYIFFGCNKLTTIYAPYNLTKSIPLPTITWYQPDGTKITELPQNLNYSIIITKNKIPVISSPYIIARKEKTAYICGYRLNMDDLNVWFYDIDGAVNKVTEYSTNASEIDMSTTGTKTLIITYNGLTAEIPIVVAQGYTVTFDLCGHGVPIAPLREVISGSLIDMPPNPVAEGYVFWGWYTDASFTTRWNFYADTVQENITLYACWRTSDFNEEPSFTTSGNLLIQGIPAQIYTGSTLKPLVTVYYQVGDRKTILKAGTDYTVKYFNNIQADTEQEKTSGGTSQTETGNGFTKDLAYVVITCKGNYSGTVYHNFHINPVPITEDGQTVKKGFVLTCTDQLVSGNKALNPFKSLKYKKAMKAGTDYTIKLTALKAFDANKMPLSVGTVINGSSNSIIPTIPPRYQGSFQVTIEGIHNYQGTITKTIYVTDKDHLVKNASVVLGKNQKNLKYTGSEIVLTPAWYDVSTKKYYVIGEDGTRTETDKNDVFTVKLGKEYLQYGKDYTIKYSDNQAAGKATMTIVGTGDYIGTKNITFKITGVSFNTKNIRMSGHKPALIYTGQALTQNDIVLTDISSASQRALNYGTDYTISYKNNLKKGTATMTFTARPISGYSGSFKKTFKITAASLGESVSVVPANPSNDSITYPIGNNEVIKLDGTIIYTKDGVKPSERIVLINRNTRGILKEGTDYTISYRNNRSVTTDSLATMTIKGKGNYNGSVVISFPIVKAPLVGNKNLTATATAIPYNMKKTDSFEYHPKIKITDKKKTLSATKDYEITEYRNCTQKDVKTYLESLANGTAVADARPYAVIKSKDGSNYEGTMEIDLSVYQTKLTAKNLYIIVSEETQQVTYRGTQVKPGVTVYYGEAGSIQEAKKAGECQENILTDKTGSYKLTKLKPLENGTGDYTIVYGTNIVAGKNKGSVTINGTGMYGGKVTVKFTILRKDIYDIAKQLIQWLNAR